MFRSQLCMKRLCMGAGRLLHWGAMLVLRGPIGGPCFTMGSWAPKVAAERKKTWHASATTHQTRIWLQNATISERLFSATVKWITTSAQGYWVLPTPLVLLIHMSKTQLQFFSTALLCTTCGFFFAQRSLDTPEHPWIKRFVRDKESSGVRSSWFRGGSQICTNGPKSQQKISSWMGRLDSVIPPLILMV